MMPITNAISVLWGTRGLFHFSAPGPACEARTIVIMTRTALVARGSIVVVFRRYFLVSRKKEI